MSCDHLNRAGSTVGVKLRCAILGECPFSLFPDDYLESRRLEDRPQFAGGGNEACLRAVGPRHREAELIFATREGVEERQPPDGPEHAPQLARHRALVRGR